MVESREKAGARIAAEAVIAWSCGAAEATVDALLAEAGDCDAAGMVIAA